MASTASTTVVATRRRSPKRIIKTSPVRRALRGPSLHLLVIPATAPAAGTMTPVDLLRRVDSMPVDMDRRAGAPYTAAAAAHTTHYWPRAREHLGEGKGG